MGKIRVLVADDHTIVREGVSLLLQGEPDIEVVGEAMNGREAVEKCLQLRPDVVLMDIAMPELNGLEATKHLKSARPEIRVLVLTVHESDEYFFQALQAGASGYVLKGATSGELVAAVRAVSSGGIFLHPAVAEKLVHDYLQRVSSNGSVRTRYDGLTPREKEVLILIAEGATNQGIADKLVLSPSTVQTHRANIMEKLQLHNRAELIKYAIRQGLIQLD